MHHDLYTIILCKVPQMCKVPAVVFKDREERHLMHKARSNTRNV